MWNLMIVVLVLAMVGCGKGRKLYAACEKQSTGLVATAKQAADPIAYLSECQDECQAVVTEDGRGKWGKLAKAKLDQIAPLLAKAKAKKAKQDAVAAAAAAKAAAAEQARDLAEAKKVVTGRGRNDRDSECLDKGLPPYRWRYDGGTRAQLDLVAGADGCSHLFPDDSDIFLFQVYCCPKPLSAFVY